MTPLLELRDLAITFPLAAGISRPVDGVSFSLERGEFLALVGESGCGKSLTGLALLRLVPAPGTIAATSSILLDGQELMTLGPEPMRRIRGRRIGMVFQDPAAALNPVLTVGAQVIETVMEHHDGGRDAAAARALRLLDEAGLPDPAGTLMAYPHQLSGGMRQRVLIALALAGEPDLLIADEPTASLDVTVQAQILELLDRLRADRGMAVLFVTHDLGIVASRADRVAVMYAGRIVEAAGAAALFDRPAHPYTRGLLSAVPRLDAGRERLIPIPGAVPSPIAWPSGCRFHPRCAERLPRCAGDAPPFRPIAPARSTACWLAEPIEAADG